MCELQQTRRLDSGGQYTLQAARGTCGNMQQIERLSLWVGNAEDEKTEERSAHGVGHPGTFLFDFLGLTSIEESIKQRAILSSFLLCPPLYSYKPVCPSLIPSSPFSQCTLPLFNRDPASIYLSPSPTHHVSPNAPNYLHHVSITLHHYPTFRTSLPHTNLPLELSYFLTRFPPYSRQSMSVLPPDNTQTPHEKYSLNDMASTLDKLSFKASEPRHTHMKTTHSYTRKRHHRDRDTSQHLLTPPLTPSSSIRTSASTDSADPKPDDKVQALHELQEPQATRFLYVITLIIPSLRIHIDLISTVGKRIPHSRPQHFAISYNSRPRPPYPPSSSQCPATG